MTRRIFVGSSTESLGRAKQICDVLSKIEETVGVLWTEVFEPGSLTFEALEQMLCRCCAAVFVATPDDKSVIRERELRTPRANVLLEFGLVAGRLGRTSIALCRYGNAELPSDLKALIIIEMGPEEQAANPAIPQQAEKELLIWGARLIPTMETFPRTAIFQGYTGRWDFTLSLKVWRDLTIVGPSYAQIVGWVDLLISASGQEGRGAAHGRLFFKLMNDTGSGGGAYQGEYRTAYEITSVVCNLDGFLELSTQAFAVQKMTTSGPPPAQLSEMDGLPEPWTSTWTLRPGKEQRTLEGEVRTEGGGITQGTVRATKSLGL